MAKLVERLSITTGLGHNYNYSLTENYNEVFNLRQEVDNSDGFINILTIVLLHFFCDALIKEIWPLCNDPIVGTNPISALKLTSLTSLLMLLKIIIYDSSYF